MLKLTLRAIEISRFPRRWVRLASKLALVLLFVCYVRNVFLGSNAHAVIEGRVYRTSQLSGEDLTVFLRKHRIRTVINLRGHCPDFDLYQEECAATAAAGVSQEDITFSANRLPPPTELRRLIDVLDRTEYPICFHCKQGADRTGLVSTMVLLLYTDASLSRARQELWPHRGHFPVARTQAMDEFFDRYETWLDSRSHTPALFRDWMLNHYKPGPAVAELAWESPIPETIPAQKSFALTLRATNRSADPWRFTPGTTAGIHLQYRLFDVNGATVHDDVAGLMRRTVQAGESIDLLLAFPKLAPGRYTLRAEMADFTGAAVSVRAKFFYQFGSDAMMATIIVK
jgi:protein tyrosine phosphatase (PTP) superfamily phosphohydrolase (DUF442 family)